MNSIQRIYITAPSYVLNQFKDRCHFYDVTVKEVLLELIVRFVDGEFDDIFDIKTIDKSVLK